MLKDFGSRPVRRVSGGFTRLRRGLSAVIFILRLYGGLEDLSAVFMAEWRAVLGKISCCEEKTTPGIIRDADTTFHFVIPQKDLPPHKFK